MKLLYLNTILFFFSVCGSAQNLVPNPSFEDTINCPDLGDIADAVSWVNPTSYSPDYYNSCVYSSGPADGFSVPTNWYGVQNARTGNAYAGIILHVVTDGREYIQTQLTDTLQSGKRYLVSFFVLLADSSLYATNNVGLLFSTSPVSSTSSLYLPYTPQIQNNSSGNPLNVLNTWIEISDTLIASGGERYVTIGNFNDDASSDTTHLNNGTNWTSFSYYYIDDVSVTLLDTANAIDSYEMNSLSVNVFPNPADDFLSIKADEQIKNAVVINMLGQYLCSFDLSKNEETINLGTIPSGEYLIKITTKSSKHAIRKIIINPKTQ